MGVVCLYVSIDGCEGRLTAFEGLKLWMIDAITLVTSGGESQV